MLLCVLRGSQYRSISGLQDEEPTEDVFCNVFGCLVGVVSDDKPPWRELVLLRTCHMANAAHMSITLVLLFKREFLVKAISQFSFYLPTYNRYLRCGGAAVDIYGLSRKPSRLTLLAGGARIAALQACVAIWPPKLTVRQR